MAALREKLIGEGIDVLDRIRPVNKTGVNRENPWPFKPAFLCRKSDGEGRDA
jgi:hypothetical protein